MNLLLNLKFLTKQVCFIILMFVFLLSFRGVNASIMLINDQNKYEYIRLFFVIITISGLISLAISILIQNKTSIVLKHYFLLLIYLIIIITFSINEKTIFNEINMLIEICSIILLIIELSIFFYVYPVFSRTKHLYRMMKIHIYSIIIFFLIYLLNQVFEFFSMTKISSRIFLFLIFFIALSAILMTLFTIIKSAYNYIKKEIYKLIFALLIGILPIIVGDIILGIFKTGVSYIYFLPSLLVFPCYLIFSFNKFEIIEVSSKKHFFIKTCITWNLLFIIYMAIINILFISSNLFIYILFTLMSIQILIVYIYNFIVNKAHIINNYNNEFIYEKLVKNNIKIPIYAFYFKDKVTNKYIKIESDNQKYPELFVLGRGKLFNTVLETEKCEDVTIYMKKTNKYDAFISFYNNESQYMNYNQFVTLITNLSFFIMNYSVNEIDQQYQDKVYLLNYALESEKERLSVFLHDDILQNIILSLNEIKRLNFDNESKSFIEDIMEESIYEIRKACDDLFPFNLDDFGLEKSIQTLVKKNLYETMVKITLNYESNNIILDKLTKISVYRMIKELINNSVKHADCSKITIHVLEAKQFLSVNYCDDGKGLDSVNIDDILKYGSNVGIKYIIQQTKVLNGSIEFLHINPDDAYKGLNVQMIFPLKEMRD